MSDTVVIIPAAGASTRMGFNKLFAELCGVPVLVHTIRRISSSDEITSIILAVPPGAEPVIQRDIVTAFQLDCVSAIVAGGATRLESVWNAVQAIPSPTSRIVQAFPSPVCEEGPASLPLSRWRERGQGRGWRGYDRTSKAR